MLGLKLNHVSKRGHSWLKVHRSEGMNRPNYRLHGENLANTSTEANLRHHLIKSRNSCDYHKAFWNTDLKINSHLRTAHVPDTKYIFCIIQRTHDVMITSSLRQNDVIWLQDVMIMLLLRYVWWESSTSCVIRAALVYGTQRRTYYTARILHPIHYHEDLYIYTLSIII